MNASESTTTTTTTTTAAGVSRELASRESDGVHVLLLWHPRDDETLATKIQSDEQDRSASLVDDPRSFSGEQEALLGIHSGSRI
jgi:hypothetical protein